MIFRPWGELDWILTNLNSYSFQLLACISTEERSIESIRILQNKNCLSKYKLFEIIDPTDTEIHKSNREKVKKVLSSFQNHNYDFEIHNLLEPLHSIVTSTRSLIDNSDGNIILDISSFPKRFFFPITKILLNSKKVENLIITYSTPQKYSEGNLSENPQAWTHLPLFQVDDPEEKVDLAIVGVGFMPLGLPHLLRDKYSQLEIKLFFPFPPGPPTYQRTWEFVNMMNTDTKVDTRQLIRIDALGLPEIFDKIRSLTNYGEKKVIFAPYGPKTMSLAMCIYASLTNSAVYYTQPTSYDPKYSTGINKCYGYCIKINGDLFYKIQK